MSALVSFEYGERPIRVVMIDGEPWWVAKDVCDVLDQPNVSQVTARLDDDEKGIHSVDTLGGAQDMQVINEAGLYSLILTSRKEQAKAFKRWVTHDVLPSIRKHGMYATDELLDNPDLLFEVVSRYREERKARLAAEAKVIELAPKASFYDHVANAEGYHDMGDVAKELGTGRNRLFEILRQMGIIMPRKPIPYQRYVDDGYFKVVETTTGPKHTTSKTVVSGKGLVYLQERIESAGGVKALEATLSRRAPGKRKRRGSR